MPVSGSIISDRVEAFEAMTTGMPRTTKAQYAPAFFDYDSWPAADKPRVHLNAEPISDERIAWRMKYMPPAGPESLMVPKSAEEVPAPQRPKIFGSPEGFSFRRSCRDIAQWTRDMIQFLPRYSAEVAQPAQRAEARRHCAIQHLQNMDHGVEPNPEYRTIMQRHLPADGGAALMRDRPRIEHVNGACAIARRCGLGKQSHDIDPSAPPAPATKVVQPMLNTPLLMGFDGYAQLAESYA